MLRLIQIVTTVQAVFDFDIRNEHGIKIALNWLFKGREGLKFVGGKPYPLDFRVQYLGLAIEIKVIGKLKVVNS